MGNPTLDPKAGGVRRIEVITGGGGRRRWRSEAKARIVADMPKWAKVIHDAGIRP